MLQLNTGLERESVLRSTLKFSNYVRKQINSISCSMEHLNILLKTGQLEEEEFDV